MCKSIHRLTKIAGAVLIGITPWLLNPRLGHCLLVRQTGIRHLYTRGNLMAPEVFLCVKAHIGSPECLTVFRCIA